MGGEWKIQYWPGRGVPPGAGKRSVSLPTHAHFSTRSPRHGGIGGRGWDEGLGTQLKWELEAREGMGGRLECTAAGSAGVQGWRGPRGRLLPPPARAGLCEVTASREEEGGGGGRGPGCLALVGQRDDET